MIIVLVFVFGLCLGSFINALLWRLREQQLASELPKAKSGKKNSHKLRAADLSIVHGRSVCPACHHQLQPKDLVPVMSWLSLRGKCRYCHKPISWQYPLVELTTALLFVLNYAFWPKELHGMQVVIFVLWLLILVGLVALTVYDLRWYLLPNRILLPLSALAGAMATLTLADSDRPFSALLRLIAAVAVGGGMFYLLFQFSKGKWIGGGDVKLGWLLGLLVATPSRSFLFIFLAALSGSLLCVPLLATKRLKSNAVIPFGPFLILGAVVTVLFGGDILHWYQYTLLAGPY